MVDCYLGEIRMFAGNYAPAGFHFCDGTQLTISDNAALYSLIGTTYGGDGTTHFALPDLRSRVPVSQGQGPGLSSYALGQTFGVENVTLTTANMGAHTHPLNATSAAASSLSPTPNKTMTLAAAPAGTYLYAQQATVPITIVALAATDVGSAGGNESHTNVMPVLGITYIIALQGIYPTSA